MLPIISSTAHPVHLLDEPEIAGKVQQFQLTMENIRGMKPENIFFIRHPHHVSGYDANGGQNLFLVHTNVYFAYESDAKTYQMRFRDDEKPSIFSKSVVRDQSGEYLEVSFDKTLEMRKLKVITRPLSDNTGEFESLNVINLRPAVHPLDEPEISGKVQQFQATLQKIRAMEPVSLSVVRTSHYLATGMGEIMKSEFYIFSYFANRSDAEIYSARFSSTCGANPTLLTKPAIKNESGDYFEVSFDKTPALRKLEVASGPVNPGIWYF